MLFRYSLLLAAAISSSSLFAAVSPAVDRAIRDTIAKANPQASVQSVHESPIPGVYAVLSDGEVLYVAEDGKHLFFQGRLFSIADRSDFAETLLAPARREAMSAAIDHAIVYKAPQEKYQITVFTDVTCGYCQMLHGHIDEYLAAGITVRYLAFPRSGPNTDSWKQMESIWCSADQKSALTAAKKKEAVAPATCANNVQQDFVLGQRIGVRATPAIFTNDGRQIGGYLDPQKMIEALNAPAQ